MPLGSRPIRRPTPASPASRSSSTPSSAELDAEIAAESDPKKKAKLEAEKATKEQWLNAIK